MMVSLGADAGIGSGLLALGDRPGMPVAFT
jgi:hypothetical protein